MYSEVLIAKYGGSGMSNVCTVCLADFVSLPAKVLWLATFFLKKKAIFVWLLCWLPGGRPGSQHMDCV